MNDGNPLEKAATESHGAILPGKVAGGDQVMDQPEEGSESARGRATHREDGGCSGRVGRLQYNLNPLSAVQKGVSLSHEALGCHGTAIDRSGESIAAGRRVGADSTRWQARQRRGRVRVNPA